MSKPNWKHIAQQLNDHLGRARLSSQEVANKAGVDRKTVERLRTGQPVRPQTLKWIEQALNTELGETTTNLVNSPSYYGGYQLDAVADYIGEYVVFRRSFDAPAGIIASNLQIQWNESARALQFTESLDNRLETGETYSYRFGGDVLIPPGLGVMNLVVRSDDGRVRLISTSMPREENGTLIMKGFILTLNELKDIGYYPVTSPIFMTQIRDEAPLHTGVVTPADSCYSWASTILGQIEEKFLP